MPRLDGFDSALFEKVIDDLPVGHQATARILAAVFSGVGSSAYAEATTVDSGQRKYNFTSSPGGPCWLALHGTQNQLSLDVRDPSRVLAHTDWYSVNEAGSQFAKGGWRRVWISEINPTATQLDALVQILQRLKKTAI